MSPVVATSTLLILVCLFSISSSIPVSVMMPLTLVTRNGTLTNPSQIQAQLQQLKSGGIDGVMMDVWWGVVENNPQQYNWSPYLQFAQLVKNAGLTFQPVMSFHQCGTNVGDACYIPLPNWVVSIGNGNPDIWYRDQQRSIDQEYISLGVDDQPIFAGRTPVQIYTDFMQSFASNFASFMPSTINQIQVGLGPSGEMRYPSYQLQNNKWSYCGIGEFQCWDNYMLKQFQQAAQQAGKNYNSPPTDAGTYNSLPDQTNFFTSGYTTDYGKFFLDWYGGQLLNHGATILNNARNIFSGVKVAAKVSGIHWWYNSPSHAAECTAGYINTNSENAYLNIGNMLAKYGIGFDFTCLEMVDSNNNCGSAPEQLVNQAQLAAKSAGIRFSGENALELCVPSCYAGGFDRIYTAATQNGPIDRFTYLRLTPQLLSGSNWSFFTSFVSRMRSV